MGISLDSNFWIAGYRPVVFKEALRGFGRTESPTNLIDLKSVFPMRRDGAIVFEECFDRGLIDPETLKATEIGEAIARAKAQQRTPLAKALTLLNDFLRRVSELNQGQRSVRFVNKVWLFGSVMREQESVGDIDLALETVRRPEFVGNYEEMQRHLNKILSTYPEAPKYWDRRWAKESWVTNRALYGSRRHPLLAGVQDGIENLASLGVPCRLIFDRERGGQVNDPILPRHPQSTGRDGEHNLPAEMPDLTPRTIRPMDARWVAGFSTWGMVSPYHIFRGWTDDAHKLFPHYPEGLRIVGDNFRLNDDFWKPKRLKIGGLDGRSAVCVINATQWWGTSVVLRRKIDTNRTAWTLNASFGDLELHRSRKWVELTTLPDIAAAISLILAVDAERMLRRAAEVSVTTTVRIELTESEISEDLKSHLVEPVRNFLKSRAIRIEPLDWQGPRVEIA
ncbi:hypothetical protein [Mesorhizobium opportunistum]|uniref:Uncharacterized protein n=1 Tax=Mesorhizobium opportunistum (strain LMG 24607 / HAMBI 3007 / WSM2075) TaxID=536019 RepID=F7XZP5_MESOW|nr:hypothetical protein [Mesorhizobium opportunistum]AEH87032.1 conserved hypothetical protein [Mesorhizobium opportunistum WSM2075]